MWEYEYNKEKNMNDFWKSTRKDIRRIEAARKTAAAIREAFDKGYAFRDATKRYH